MSGPINHQTPLPTSPPRSSPGPIAQQLVRLQGTGQAPPNSPQPTATPEQVSSEKKERRKEAREWLNLIGVLLIPIIISIYTIINNTQQTTLAQQQHDSDQYIAQQNRQADVTNQLDQQRETALKTYEDDISNLLLDRHLATSRPGDEVRTIALAKTLEVLHQLDGPRNVRAIQFLQDAQLISTKPAAKTPHNIIDFSNADLANDDLTGANLSGANLTRANLSEANLSEANLTRVNLNGANLGGAYLNGANLNGADLTRADLTCAYLTGANLTKADLSEANLNEADLTRTDLTRTIMPNGTRHSYQRDDENFCQ
jgi:uncharacterized protein YjbI with pentapeptide repeats